MIAERIHVQIARRVAAEAGVVHHINGRLHQRLNRLNISDSVTVEGDDVTQEYYNVVNPGSAGNIQ